MERCANLEYLRGVSGNDEVITNRIKSKETLVVFIFGGRIGKPDFQGGGTGDDRDTRRPLFVESFFCGYSDKDDSNQILKLENCRTYTAHTLKVWRD